MTEKLEYSHEENKTRYGSGSLKVIEKGAKIFESTWEASGAGSWAAYDPATGQQIEGGSWR